jgi:hypothetical protein
MQCPRQSLFASFTPAPHFAVVVFDQARAENRSGELAFAA